METLQAILNRYSCRIYENKLVPDDILGKILAAGCAAPVGMGAYDSLHMTVVQNRELLKEIAAAFANNAGKAGADPFYGAPTAVFVSSKTAQLPNIEYANVACVITTMALAATDCGVNSVYLWGPAVAVKGNAELMEKLRLPAGFLPISVLALGYGNGEGKPKEALKQTIGLDYLK